MFVWYTPTPTEEYVGYLARLERIRTGLEAVSEQAAQL